MTLNKMMIIGNLGADPELRYTPGGKAVTNLRVAVNDNRKGPDGEWIEETQWFRVELWDQAAERAPSGSGRATRFRRRTAPRPRVRGNDGQKRSSVEIRFARVISLERRDPGEAFGIGDAASDAAAAAVPRGAETGTAADDRDRRPRRHPLLTARI